MIIAKSDKKHFNKNLVVSVEDVRRFQSSNKCWICNKLYTDEDKKVGDNDHITGKYRGSAHSNCNINFKLTKKVPAILHNLKGYDGHLIMQEIGKFDVETIFKQRDYKNTWLLQLIKTCFLFTACNL